MCFVHYVEETCFKMSFMFFVNVKIRRGGDVAQSVERRTGMPMTQVRFPVRQGIFLVESTFSADSSTVSIHPGMH